jgi:hypothetical protein
MPDIFITILSRIMGDTWALVFPLPVVVEVEEEEEGVEKM